MREPRVMGYYFIYTEYENGRYAIGLGKYRKESEAIRALKRRRRAVKDRPEIKRVRIGYQPSMGDIDIKKYI